MDSREFALTNASSTRTCKLLTKLLAISRAGGGPPVRSRLASMSARSCSLDPSPDAPDLQFFALPCSDSEVHSSRVLYWYSYPWPASGAPRSLRFQVRRVPGRVAWPRGAAAARARIRTRAGAVRAPRRTRYYSMVRSIYQLSSIIYTHIKFCSAVHARWSRSVASRALRSA